MKILGYTIVTLSCAIALIIALLTTTIGSRILLLGITKFSGNMIQAGMVEGGILTDLTIGDLKITTSSTTVEVANIKIRWQNFQLLAHPKLEIEQLSVAGLTVISNKNDATDTLFSLPDINLPLAVTIHQFELEGVTLKDFLGNKTRLVNSSSVSVSVKESLININDFKINGDKYSLSTKGSIKTAENWRLDLTGSWKIDGFGFHKTKGNYSLKGPLDSPQISLGVQEPGQIHINGQVQSLFAGLKWQANLEAQSVDLSLLIRLCPKIKLSTVNADINGDTKGYSGNVEAHGDWSGLTDLHLQSNLTADWLGIIFNTLQISRNDSTASTEDFWISWQKSFSWEGAFLLRDFDLSTLPGDISGLVNADVTSKGEVLQKGLLATFAVKKFEGVFNQQMFTSSGELELTSDGIHSNGFHIEGVETKGVADIIQGEFYWSPYPRWAMDAHLQGFNPALIYPYLMGSVDSTFTTTGSIGPEGLAAALDIKQISGQLFDQGLSGQGTFNVAEGHFQASNFIIKNGQSIVTLDGQAGGDDNLQFSLFTANLGDYFADVSGKLEISGILSGSKDQPKLKATGNAVQLRYQAYEVDTVSFQADADLTKNGVVNGTLELDNFSFDNFEIDSGKIGVEGRLDAHQVSVQLSSLEYDLGFDIKGGYSDKWVGILQDLSIHNQNAHSVSQIGQSAVELSPSAMNIDNFCTVDDVESEICFSGGFSISDKVEWFAKGITEKLQLASLNNWTTIGVPITGNGTFAFELKGEGRRPTLGSANAKFSDIDFNISEWSDKIGEYRINKSSIDLQLNNAAINSNIEIEMADGGSMRLDLSTEKLNTSLEAIGDSGLSGEVVLDNLNIGFLSALTNQLVEVTGTGHGQYSLGGTLKKPQLTGKGVLQDGGLSVPDLGVTFSDIEVELNADPSGTQIRGNTSSGEGKLEIVGTIAYGPQEVNGKFQITGNDFELVSLPEYSFHVTPEVQFDFTADSITVTGQVLIPRGVIYPEEMHRSINESNDVEFNDSRSREDKANRSAQVDLDVQLGDNIGIEGYGISGNLGGEVAVQTNSTGLLVGSGEIELVGGTLEYYNQALDIERGRVLFTEGPLNNPGVDVRIKKQVRSQSKLAKGATVGIEISGLAENLHFQLFSDPYMEDVEILSYLVVGQEISGKKSSKSNFLNPAAFSVGIQNTSDSNINYDNIYGTDNFRNLSGNDNDSTSLVLGRRLGKRFYISYDVNTYNQQGMFRIRYDLSKGFFVETQSSSESSGADLLYIFER